MSSIDVVAVPLNDHEYWVECSRCGPIGIAGENDLTPIALDHLEYHGIQAMLEE